MLSYFLCWKIRSHHMLMLSSNRLSFVVFFFFPINILRQLFDVSTELNRLFQYLPILVKHFKKQHWGFAVLRSLQCLSWLSNVTPIHTTNQQALPYRGPILIGFLNEDFHLGVSAPYTETYCCLSLHWAYWPFPFQREKKRRQLTQCARLWGTEWKQDLS